MPLVALHDSELGEVSINPACVSMIVEMPGKSLSEVFYKKSGVNGPGAHITVTEGMAEIRNLFNAALGSREFVALTTMHGENFVLNAGYVAVLKPDHAANATGTIIHFTEAVHCQRDGKPKPQCLVKESQAEIRDMLQSPVGEPSLKLLQA